MYTAPTVTLHATLARAPNGAAGAFHTLSAMRQLVKNWRTDPDVISRAISTVYLTPPKDEHAEIDALFISVRDGIRYVRDVHQVETLSTPVMTLRRGVGDCDDKATLLATLAEAIGYPTRFVMGAFDGGDFSHVWVQIYSDGDWIDADTTEDQPLGWRPPGTTRIYQERL